jgi:hypothetical protein
MWNIPNDFCRMLPTTDGIVWAKHYQCLNLKKKAASNAVIPDVVM